MQPVTVFKNLLLPLILGTDTIENLARNDLSLTKIFVFFKEESHPQKFQKADLRVI